MSRNQRLGLVALVIAVAVGAFLIAKPGSQDEQRQPTTSPAGTTSTQTTTGNARATEPEQPPVARVVIKAGKPVGGVRSIQVKTGDQVRLEVSADSPQQLHLHGYDIERTAMPGKPASFRFKARAEGQFELESHSAEHAGLEPLMARLAVRPS